MRPRIEFDRGRIILHSDGPWQELTPYELADLVADAGAALKAEIMWRRYPPATDYAADDIPG